MAFYDYERETEANEARDLILELAEVFGNAKLNRLIELFSSGGAAYHQRAVARILAYHNKAEDTQRLAHFFGDKDLAGGMSNPIAKAVFMFGVTELMDSKGVIDRERVSKILQAFEVSQTEDLRDNLTAAASKHNAAGEPTHWDLGDLITALWAGEMAVTQLKKVPWKPLGGVLRLVARRGRP